MALTGLHAQGDLGAVADENLRDQAINQATAAIAALQADALTKVNAATVDAKVATAMAPLPSTYARITDIVGPPLAADVTQHLYARTRPTPDGGTGVIMAHAVDPSVPGRVWSQGTRFAQLGFGPVDGSSWTPAAAAPGAAASGIIAIKFTATHMWVICGPQAVNQGSVWRSPLPDAAGGGMAFTNMFDLAAPPGGITPGPNAFWFYGSLTSDPTGAKIMLLEYGTVVTGGPSAYLSNDSGATWTKVKTWAGAKHGHAVQHFNGAWWAMLGDAGSADMGLWSAPDATPTVWTQVSLHGEALGGSVYYGVNFMSVTVNGRQIIAVEYDGLYNKGLIFLSTAQPGLPRTFLTTFTLPPAYMGTGRQLTLDPATGNLYWYQTSEVGVWGTTDSIWMTPPPYTTAILLESFPYSSEAQGNAVISGDYLWFGQNCCHREKIIGQA